MIVVYRKWCEAPLPLRGMRIVKHLIGMRFAIKFVKKLVFFSTAITESLNLCEHSSKLLLTEHCYNRNQDLCSEN